MRSRVSSCAGLIGFLQALDKLFGSPLNRGRYITHLVEQTLQFWRHFMVLLVCKEVSEQPV